jgi:hypothetical protein
MDTIKYPEWQEPYQAALRENDPQKLTGLVRDAEGAIFARMLALGASLGDNDERQAILDACDGLLIIKTKILEWPAPYAESQ